MRSEREIADTLDGFLTQCSPEDSTAGSRGERAAKLSALLLAVAGAGAHGQAHATDIGYGGSAQLSIIPEESSVLVGDTVTADVSLSGLTNQLIGGYDLTIDFNPSILSVANVSFGPYLDGPLNSLQGTNNAVSSELEVYEVSFGNLANQTGYGTLPFFSITFDTLAAGTSALTFDPVANAGTLLSDQNSNAFTNFTVIDGSVSVTAPVAAPELDGATAGGAITCLIATLLIVTQRRRRA
jgi:Cohesin domain